MSDIKLRIIEKLNRNEKERNLDKFKFPIKQNN